MATGGFSFTAVSQLLHLYRTPADTPTLGMEREGRGASLWLLEGAALLLEGWAPLLPPPPHSRLYLFVWMSLFIFLSVPFRVPPTPALLGCLPSLLISYPHPPSRHLSPLPYPCVPLSFSLLPIPAPAHPCCLPIPWAGQGPSCLTLPASQARFSQLRDN